MKIVFQNGGNSLIDKLIKWVNKTQWTHACLVLNETLDGKALIVQSATHGGVSFNVINGIDTTSEAFQINNPTDDISCLFPFIGDQYGYIDALGFGIAKVFKLKKNPLTNGMICIKLVVYWLQNSPMKNEFSTLDVNTASFDDVYNIVSKSNNFTKIN